MPIFANQNEQLFTQIVPYFPSLDKMSIPRSFPYLQEKELQIRIRMYLISFRLKKYNLDSSYVGLCVA